MEKEEYNSQICDMTKSKMSETEENFDLTLLTKFNIVDFMKEFDTNTDLALKTLLSMQSNDSPLKKGGEGIAFMADALFLSTRDAFDADENTIFDVLISKISSRPEDEYFKISIDDIIPYISKKNNNKYYCKKILQNGTCKIKKKNELSFPIPGTNRTYDKPWHDGLVYTRKEDASEFVEDDYIYFKPTKIFKVLCSSSTVMHGAHYKIEIASSLVGYPRKMYYWMEAMKSYSAYPGARRGYVKITLDELRWLFKFPDKIRPTDIKKVLISTKEKFDSIDNIDISFEFQEYKVGGKIKGFIIQISDLNKSRVVKSKVEAIEDKKCNPERITFETLLSNYNFKPNEFEEVYKAYKDNNRNVKDLINGLALIDSKGIVSPKAYLIEIFKNGVFKQNMIKKNNFSNFNQRKYDTNELEKVLLTTNIAL